MSDNRPDQKPREDPGGHVPGWFDDVRRKIADWLAPLLDPPLQPAPVPVRR